MTRVFFSGTSSYYRSFSLSILFMLFFVFLLNIEPSSYAQENDNDPHATGLIFPTAREIDAFKKTHGKIEKVLPNKIALDRVNSERAKKGLPTLPETGIVPFGKEIISSMDSSIPETENITTQAASADNSTLSAFPVIRSQGSLGSCTAFAITYYNLTHTAGLTYGWDNKNEDNTKKFSPKWSYNLVNRGENNGSSFFENYDVLEEHGAATWEEFPYDGVDYRQWCLNTGTWRNAINYRINPVVYTPVNEINPDLAIIKGLLSNGHIVTFGTYISNWQFTRISDDKTTSEDNAFVRQQIAYWVNGNQGGHAMTIVGYNDAIWTDINNNRVVDLGERGAFKIANSWGTNWGNGGFTWLAYDALRKVTAITGGPGGTGRVGAIVTGMVFDITMKYNLNIQNTPKMLAEFTVNHLKRNQLRISLGISDVDPLITQPEITWFPGAIDLDGGPYDFNGETSRCDGTFVFDFTDILLPDSVERKYYLGVYDSILDGNPATLSSFKIIANGIPTESINDSFTIDGGQKYADLKYAFGSGSGNIPPIAVATANPLEGYAPLTVTFNGSQSSDLDGSIVKCFWNFNGKVGPPGDSSGASGVTATHTYNDPGIYNAKLTVTDNSGATSSTTVTITVNVSPATTMHVQSIAMSTKKVGAGVYALAVVTIYDKNTPEASVSGATVYGTWSGATSDIVSGLTNATGQVTLKSSTVKANAGTNFIFTVDDVTKSGWFYDSSANHVTSGSTTYGVPSAPAKDWDTQLAQAFPNPSNPDVWIPFALSSSEQVIIKIYNSTGYLIRTLDLGQKSPGAYFSKEKSAHWDGKNESGERVSSGIYFYIMQAGDFTATRKLVIDK